MIGTSTPGSPASTGLLDSLRSWLRTWSGETWQPSEDMLGDAGGPNALPQGVVRVLVVDDNPVNLSIISAQLQSKGLLTMLAADGAEAVALACEWHFDLILMDLQMPILDGIEATAAIRRFETTGSRPAVPVVAYTSTCLRPGLLAAHGMNGSLAKPCDDQDLEDCLVQWCPTYHPELAATFGPSGNSSWPKAATPSLDSHCASMC